MQRHPHRLDLESTKVDEAQKAGHRQPKPAPYLTLEEAGRHQHIPVASDEFPPGHPLFALWSGRDTMTLEDIAGGLITDRIAQVLQGP